MQKVLVKEGAHVKAGQLLVVLDDTRAPAADLANAQTRLKAPQAYTPTCWPEAISSRTSLPPQPTCRRPSPSAIPRSASFPRSNGSSRRGAATADEVAAASDRLARAKADLAQFQSQVRYSPDLQHAQDEIEVADSKANIQLAEELLRNCNIRAPFDGTVYFIPARVGAFVNIGDLAFAGSRSFPAAGSRLRR